MWKSCKSGRGVERRRPPLLQRQPIIIPVQVLWVSDLTAGLPSLPVTKATLNAEAPSGPVQLTPVRAQLHPCWRWCGHDSVAASMCKAYELIGGICGGVTLLYFRLLHPTFYHGIFVPSDGPCLMDQANAPSLDRCHIGLSILSASNGLCLRVQAHICRLGHGCSARWLFSSQPTSGNIHLDDFLSPNGSLVAYLSYPYDLVSTASPSDANWSDLGVYIWRSRLRWCDLENS